MRLPVVVLLEFELAPFLLLCRNLGGDAETEFALPRYSHLANYLDHRVQHMA